MLRVWVTSMMRLNERLGIGSSPRLILTVGLGATDVARGHLDCNGLVRLAVLQSHRRTPIRPLVPFSCLSVPFSLHRRWLCVRVQLQWILKN